MRGGHIEIFGNAGDHLGAPLAGELVGMSGGVLVVHGKAGARAADRMRRGLMAILKGAGDHAGCRMIAGTLVVTGGAGANARLSDAARFDPARSGAEELLAELRRMRLAR